MKRCERVCLKFDQTYANELRRHRCRPGEKWHLDEVFLTINGKQHSLWRAVDQNGNILDILVQSRHDKQAAKKFFRELLQGLEYVPRVMITDKLASYGAAKQEILSGVEHRRHKGLGHPSGNSRQPTRQRERTMRRFKSSLACAMLPLGLWSDFWSFSATTITFKYGVSTPV